MSVNVANQIVGQVQFLGLLTELNIKWPDTLEDIFKVLAFANLDFRKVIGDTAEFPSIDFRIMFILFAILLPILICIGTLLLFASPLDVLLFCSLSVGAMLFITWIFSYAFSTTIGDYGNDQLLFAGITLIVIPILVIVGRVVVKAIIAYVRRRAGKEKKRDDVGEHMRKMRMRERKFHRPLIFKFLLYGFGCSFACAFLMGAFDVPVSVGRAGFYSGIGFAGAAFLAFLMVILLSFDRTRRGIQSISDVIQRYGLMLIIAAITASFVPAVSYSSTTFLCADYTCPAFTKFNPSAYRPSGNYTRSQDIYCDSCNFITYPNGPKCSNVNASAMCTAFSGYRNWREPEVPCDDAAQNLFYASAGIVIIVYLISIPTLFYIIIRELTTTIAELVHLECPQQTDNPEADDRENWRRKLLLVQPTASSLYESYSFPHRYFSLWTLLHRLLVTIALVIVGPLETEASMPIVLVLYVLMLLMVVCYKPYLRPVEQALGVILALCNVFNSLFSLGYFYDILPDSTYMTAIFMLVNFAIPTIVVFAMMFLAFKRAGQVTEPVRRRASANGRRTSVGGTHYVVGSANGPDHQPTDEDLDEEQKQHQQQEMRRYGDARDQDKNLMEQMALDKSTQSRILTRCFVFIGVFFFTALTAALIGYFQQETSPYRIVTNPLQQSVSYTLGPYKTWGEMTNDCCCMTTANPSYDYAVMERWVCNSGITFNRGRVSRDGVNNGTSIRAVCAPTSGVLGCSIMVVRGELQMVCPTQTRDKLLRDGVITRYAYDYYF